MTSQRNGARRDGPTGTWLALAAWLLVLGSGSVALGDPKTVLDARIVEQGPDHLAFALELPAGLPPALAERLVAGERVTVRYVVEVFRDRRFWLNGRLGRAEAIVTATFDPVTRRYALERTLPGAAVERVEAGEEAEAHRWLTRLSTVDVPATAERRERPRVRYRARAILDRRLVALVWPTTTKSRWARGPLADAAP